MSDEWPMDFEGQVAGIEVILRGWIQNLARNAEGEGMTLEPEVVSEALSNLAGEYNDLATGSVDDIEDYLRAWEQGEGRGSE